MKLILASTAVVMAAAAYPATAVVPPSLVVRQDIQCLLIASVVMNKVSDEEAKRGLTALIAYYYGHIRALAPDLAMVDAFKGEAASIEALPEKDRTSAAERCAAEGMTIGQNMMALGESLQASAPHSSSSSS